ncbi:unnamed protein product [Euphydryas editha]|uniref:Uncharacterized protein n=1 Tax=Euphydryas editha TaxID=104508 RepID=A0AAU9TPH5_EUPED|nr:unnamed protein product [Euphydryas editha]
MCVYEIIKQFPLVIPCSDDEHDILRSRKMPDTAVRGAERRGSGPALLTLRYVTLRRGWFGFTRVSRTGYADKRIRRLN